MHTKKLAIRSIRVINVALAFLSLFSQCNYAETLNFNYLVIAEQPAWYRGITERVGTLQISDKGVGYFRTIFGSFEWNACDRGGSIPVDIRVSQNYVQITENHYIRECALRFFIQKDGEGGYTKEFMGGKLNEKLVNRLLTPKDPHAFNLWVTALSQQHPEWATKEPVDSGDKNLASPALANEHKAAQLEQERLRMAQQRERTDAENLQRLQAQEREHEEKLKVAEARRLENESKAAQLELERVRMAQERERLDTENLQRQQVQEREQEEKLKVAEARRVENERKAAQLEEERVRGADKKLLAEQLEKMQLLISQLEKANAGAARITEVSPTPPQVFANRKALVIGNDLYAEVSPLNNAVADAESMAKALVKVGYKVTKYVNLPEKAFRLALRDFRQQVDGGDEVLFFYAGHGVQLANANYLLPIDIKGESEEQVKDDAVLLQRFLDDMQDKKTKFALAVIDACRDNPFKGQGRAIGTRGMAPTSAATGQMVMFSAGSGQQALDKLGPKDPEKNGLFTRIFVTEMLKPGIPVDRVMRNVRNRVVEQAKSVGHEQTPALYDQSIGEFYFLN